MGVNPDDPLVYQLSLELGDVLKRLAERLAAERADFIAEHRLLNAAGAATLLGVRVSWIRDQTQAGELPAIRLGGLVRYHGPTLLAWALHRQEVPRGSSR